MSHRRPRRAATARERPAPGGRHPQYRDRQEAVGLIHGRHPLTAGTRHSLSRCPRRCYEGGPLRPPYHPARRAATDRERSVRTPTPSPSRDREGAPRSNDHALTGVAPPRGRRMSHAHPRQPPPPAVPRPRGGAAGCLDEHHPSAPTALQQRLRQRPLQLQQHPLHHQPTAEPRQASIAPDHPMAR